MVDSLISRGENENIIEIEKCEDINETLNIEMIVIMKKK